MRVKLIQQVSSDWQRFWSLCWYYSHRRRQYLPT